MVSYYVELWQEERVVWGIGGYRSIEQGEIAQSNLPKLVSYKKTWRYLSSTTYFISAGGWVELAKLNVNQT